MSSAVTLPVFVSPSLSACHTGVAFLAPWLPSPVITFGTRFASRLSTLAPVFPISALACSQDFFYHYILAPLCVFIYYLYCSSASESQLSSWPDYERDVRS